MPVKKCALCKKTAYNASRVNAGKGYWLCSTCQSTVNAALETASTVANNAKPTSVGLCEKCKKLTGNCRFSASQRRKMTACSDWEGKHQERNLRRWAKFEA